MRRQTILGLVVAVGVAGASAGCREEGPLEKAGRELDEAAEELADRARRIAEEGALEKKGRDLDEKAEDLADKAARLGKEGMMERIGRDMDEAAEETKQAIREAVDALEDLGK